MAKHKQAAPNLRYRSIGLDGDTIVNEKREIRSRATNKYWHKVTPEGTPVFPCKCPAQEHNLTLKKMQEIFEHLMPFPGERWDLICDGEEVVLVPPGAAHQGKPRNKRLVSVASDPIHILIFYQVKE